MYTCGQKCWDAIISWRDVITRKLNDIAEICEFEAAWSAITAVIMGLAKSCLERCDAVRKHPHEVHRHGELLLVQAILPHGHRHWLYISCCG